MSDINVEKELFIKATECKDADELVAFCKENGKEITREDAEKFLAQTKEQEISIDNLDEVSGGRTSCYGAVSIPCIGRGL